MEHIKEIPHSQRISWVSAIQETISRERVRVQIIQGKPIEMWGFVWLNRLPFCFRAWPSVKRLDFLEDGLKVQTAWGFVHRPYEPLAFVPPILTEGVTKDDMVYILEGLGVSNRNIKIGEALSKRKKAYKEFYELYSQDLTMRKAYSAAVSIVCDEKEAELHLPS